MKNINYLLVYIACIILFWFPLSASTYDRSVWVGSHEGFTVNDAYRFLLLDVEKRHHGTFVIDDIVAHKIDGTPWYYLSVFYGKKLTNDVVKVVGRQGFRVFSSGNVVPYAMSAVTNEMLVSACSYPEIRICLQLFGVDVEKVHRIRRFCVGGSDERWNVLGGSEDCNFMIRTEEILGFVNAAKRTPMLGVSAGKLQINKAKRSRIEEMLATARNGSYVGMGATDLEKILDIEYEPEPSSGYSFGKLHFEPLGIGMATRCGWGAIGDDANRQILLVWQVCDSNGEWKVVKDVSFPKDFAEAMLR